MSENVPRDQIWSCFREGTHEQFAWDATSLSAFMECPRKYQLMMLDKIGPKENATSLRFGTLYHKGLELYDRYVAEGDPHDVAQAKMVQYLLENTWDDRQVDDIDNGGPYVGVIGTGHPWHSGKEPGTIDPYKNRETLIRSCVWYTEQFRDDNFKTLILANGKPAVELSFKFDIGNGILWCGHLDRVGEWMGSKYVLDRKTTKTTPGQYYFSQYDLDTQMDGYTLAGRLLFDTPIRGVVIDVAQIAVGFTRFERAPTMRTDAQIDEFLDDVHRWIQLAHYYAKQGHFPQNKKSCHKFSGCPYKKICSADPRIRPAIIKDSYIEKIWNPLIER